MTDGQASTSTGQSRTTGSTSSDGDVIAEQAVSEWTAAAAEHAPGQAVMIARDNDTRGRLNELAREQRSAAGELGREHSYGGTPIAVGERVICRDNDARVGVDNGTRGTVRHVDSAKIVLETDSGAVRDLPASYVADHVEHAYCLTGHGMQGGTVEEAIVIASPEDLTAGWSYSALSRARGATRLLISDIGRRDTERADHAPDGARPDRSRSAVISRAMRRMLDRDDEDLAVDQLRAAGLEDDAGLVAHRAGAGTVKQEAGARRAEPVEPAATLTRLTDLREQIGRLQLTLGALATKSLARFDELDARARDLGAKRSEYEDRLAALDQPTRRFGRRRDPDAEERAFLQNAIEMDTGALADLTVDRARLQRELGDPDQVRSERDGIEIAIGALRRDHDQLRAVLVQREIGREPGWLTAALGERPEGSRERGTWEQTARAVAGFRLDHDVVDDNAPLGPEPSGGGDNRRDWDSSECCARTCPAAAGPRARRARAWHRPRDRMMPGHSRPSDPDATV